MSGAETVLVPVALTPATVMALRTALEAAGRRTASVVLLRSVGEGEGVFCRGFAPDDEFGEAPERGVDAFVGALVALRATPQVTIGIVDGPCIGGGLAIVALCDWVVATSRASFALPELTLGLFPAIVYPCLLDRMPPQKARALAYLGASVGVEDATLLGLVDERVEHPRMARDLASRVRKFARLDPSALRQFKRTTTEGTRLGRKLRAAAEETLARLALPEVARRIRMGSAEE